jgi:hypothetical protein
VKIKYLFKSDWILSAVKIALIIGTILFAINHGEAVIEHKMNTGRWVSVVLSYLVPYTVYIIGKASNIKGK